MDASGARADRACRIKSPVGTTSSLLSIVSSAGARARFNDSPLRQLAWCASHCMPTTREDGDKGRCDLERRRQRTLEKH